MQDPALLPTIIGRPGLPKSKLYREFRSVRQTTQLVSNVLQRICLHSLLSAVALVLFMLVCLSQPSIPISMLSRITGVPAST